MDLIDVARYTNRWQALVNAIIQFRVLQIQWVFWFSGNC